MKTIYRPHMLDQGSTFKNCIIYKQEFKLCEKEINFKDAT